MTETRIKVLLGADNPVQLLLIENDPNDIELCLNELKKEGIAARAELVQTRQEFINQVQEKPFDLILADYNLPNWKGTDAIPILQQLGVDIPVIVLTGFLGEENAVECFKLGAVDVVFKEHLARLPEAVRRALRETALRFEAHQAKVELAEANRKLKVQVEELQRLSMGTNLLREMGDLLQTCLTTEEAYQVIHQAAEKLFPTESGVLCMLNSSRNLLEPAAFWGEFPPAEGVFAPEDCWAMRRASAQLVMDGRGGLVCKHLGASKPSAALCVPMMAQGECLGLLHLRWNEACSSGNVGEDGIDGRQQLAVAVAERVAVAIVSLRLRERLRLESTRDPLTGLFNRRYMEESLDREMRRAIRSRRPLSAIMLDIDNFKHFNDTCGHEAGDILLMELSRFLQNRTRKEDIACRYGGEEFVLILPEAALEIAQQRAEDLRQEAKHLQVRYRGQILDRITLSLGVSGYPEHADSTSELLRIADAALCRAKAEGRDRVLVGWPAAIKVEPRLIV